MKAILAILALAFTLSACTPDSPYYREAKPYQLTPVNDNR